MRTTVLDYNVVVVGQELDFRGKLTGVRSKGREIFSTVFSSSAQEKGL